MLDANPPAETLRVAFDVGGTFTDALIAGNCAALYRYNILTLAEPVGADVRGCTEQAIGQRNQSLVSVLVDGTAVAASTVLERIGARGNSTALVGTPDTVAEALVRYYDLGATSLLIRGYDPLPDAVTYGQELIPKVRELVAARDAARP